MINGSKHMKSAKDVLFGGIAKTSQQNENNSCTSLLIKWLSNVRLHDFIGNNSQMSIDRPKPANSNTRTVYAKVL